MTFEADGFTVSGQYSQTVTFDEITDVSLDSTLPRVRSRLNRFAGMGEQARAVQA